MPPRCAVCAREGGDAGIYRCLSCTYGDLDPFDICSACEKLSSHYHDSTHVFLYVKPVAITTLLGWDTEPLNRVPRPLADANVPTLRATTQRAHTVNCLQCTQQIVGVRWMSIGVPAINLCSNCYENASTLFPEKSMWVKHKSLFELNTQPTALPTDNPKGLAAKTMEEPVAATTTTKSPQVAYQGYQSYESDGYSDAGPTATAAEGAYDDGADAAETSNNIAAPGYGDSAYDSGYVAIPKPQHATASGAYSDASQGYSVSDGYDGGYTESSTPPATSHAISLKTPESGAYSAYGDASEGYTDEAEVAKASQASKASYSAYVYASEEEESSDSTPSAYSDNGGYSDNSRANAYSDQSGGYSDNASPTLKATEEHKNVALRTESSERDWNGEFQELFEERLVVSNGTVQEKLHVATKLRALASEFISTAMSIGQTIIEEAAVPAAKKTVRPQNVGGIAGGEKYMEQGIFFKFAIDAFGVYGGDEFAMKAAGHELNGLKAYFNCRVKDLHCPFMLLIDYRGYRLIATTKLPIGKNSLIYGSADGGVTIKKEDPTFNAMMEEAAKILNIKKHIVGMKSQQVELAAPTDIEGHIGSDGRLYVLDTARVCPPEPTQKSFIAIVIPADHLSNTVRREKWKPLPSPYEMELTAEKWMAQVDMFLKADDQNGEVASEEFMEGILYHKKPPADAPRDGILNCRASTLIGKVIRGNVVLVLKGRKGAQLFNLLRHSLVKSQSHPLSSDAFTPFGKNDAFHHNKEVEDAFYSLLGTTTGSFAAALDNTQAATNREDLIKLMQSYGINIRLMGFVRSHIPESRMDVRSLLLIEMVTRVTKNYLRARLRKTNAAHESVEDIIVTHFNLLLGDSNASTFFWHTFVKAQLSSKFGKYGQALTLNEMETQYDLRTQINKLVLFQSLQKQVGAEFKEDVQLKFQMNPDLFAVRTPFSPSDIGRLSMQLRNLLHPELDAEIHGLVLEAMAMQRADGLNVVEFLKERFGANSVEVAHEYLRDAHEILLAGPREESGNKILELVDMALGVFSSSPATCPMELTIKAFYLRGCVFYHQRAFGESEAYLRAAFEGLSRLTGTSHKPSNDIDAIETDRPFALLILDRLAHLMLQLRRTVESWAFAGKFVRFWQRFAFSGNGDELIPLFGRRIPIAFALIAEMQVVGSRYTEKINLEPYETRLNQSASGSSSAKEWIDRVMMKELRDYTGMSLAPDVLQRYVDDAAYKRFVYYSKGALEICPWLPSSSRKAILEAPFTLLENSSEEWTVVWRSKRGMKQMEYNTIVVYKVLDQRARLSQIPEDAIVARQSISFTASSGYVSFVNTPLARGVYALAVTNDNNEAEDEVASNVISVIPDSKRFAFAYDAKYHWLSYDPFFEGKTIVSAAISDCLDDRQDPKTTALVVDIDGKVYACQADNFAELPPETLWTHNRKVPEKHSWALMHSLSAFKIVQVSASHSHFLALSDNGDIYSWGTCNYGELGHGENVERTDPRLVRRLKGKGIVSIHAGDSRSLALDNQGKVYQWGYGGTSLPELAPISIQDPNTKVVRVATSVHTEERSRPYYFFEFNLVAYITDTGRAFVATKDECEEMLAFYKHFVVDIALGDNFAVAVTDSGELYAAGVNTLGELGTGMRLVGSQHTDPPKFSTKVDGVGKTKFSRVWCTSTTVFALGRDGSVWTWGGGDYVVRPLEPSTEIAVQALTASSRQVFMWTGLPPALSEPHREVDKAKEKRVTEQIFDKLKYGLQVHERDGDYVVLWNRPRTVDFSSEHIKWVTPGRDKFEHDLEWLDQRYQIIERAFTGELIFSHTKKSPNTFWSLPPGIYDVVYFAGEQEQLRLSNIEVKYNNLVAEIVPSKTKVKPGQTVTVQWRLNSRPPGVMLALRNLDTGSIMNVEQIDQEKEQGSKDFQIYAEGKIGVQFEVGMTSTQQPGFILGEPVVINSTSGRYLPGEVKGTLKPEGPYEPKQVIKIDFEFDPIPDRVLLGNEFFGLYRADDDSTYATPMATAMPRSLKDEVDLHLPGLEGKYILKLQGMEPGVGICILWTTEVNINSELAEQKKAAATSPATVSPVEVPNSEGLAPALPDIVIPSYSSWEDFWAACDIEQMYIQAYSMIMSAQQIQTTSIKDFDYVILDRVGIKMPGHQLKIMGKVNEIKQAELKKMVATYLSALVAQNNAPSPSLAAIIGKM